MGASTRSSVSVVSSKASLGGVVKPSKESDWLQLRKDLLLIVVGRDASSQAVALRRFKAGGRLHVLFEDALTLTEEACVNDDVLLWSPPSEAFTYNADCSAACTQLRAQLGCSQAPRRLVKYGADVCELPAGGRASVLVARGERVGLRAYDAAGSVLWEVSGHVVVDGTCDDVVVKSAAAMPFAMVGRPRFALYALALFLVQLGYVLSSIHFEPLASDFSFPFWRVWTGLTGCQMFFGVVSVVYGLALTGVEWFTTPLAKVLNMISFPLVCSITYPIVIGGYTQTIFLAACTAHVTQVGIVLPCHVYYTGSFHVAKRSGWVWMLVVVLGGFGGWILFYGDGFAYVALFAWKPSVANAFLPLATTGIETLLVSLIGWAYGYVCKTGHPGRQCFPLLWAVGLVHAMAQGTRVIATLCAAIISNGYAWVPSVLMSTCLNVVTRYSWPRSLFVRLVSMCSPAASDFMCPGLINKVHDECKFTFTYAGFIFPVALAVGRWMMGLPALVNTPGLVCLVAQLVLALAEDAIVVFEKVPFAPPLLRHAKRNRELPFLSDSRVTSNSANVDGPLPSCVTAAARMGRCKASVQLHGIIEAPHRLGMATILPAVYFSRSIMQLILGPGFLIGMCEVPLAPDQRTGQAFFWSYPLQC